MLKTKLKCKKQLLIIENKILKGIKFVLQKILDVIN